MLIKMIKNLKEEKNRKSAEIIRKVLQEIPSNYLYGSQVEFYSNGAGMLYLFSGYFKKGISRCIPLTYKEFKEGILYLRNLDWFELHYDVTFQDNKGCATIKQR